MRTIILLMLSLNGVSAMANVTGYVTPSSLTFTITSAYLTSDSNQSIALISSSTTHSFNRTDSDMSASSLGAISVPRGRYIAAQVCYNTSRSVVVNGNKYEGTNGTAFNDGAILYSTGSDATQANTLTTTAGTATTLSNLVVGNGTNNCSSTSFATPVCVAVAADQASVCQSNDKKIDPSVTSPNLNLMLDMYHCVGVDASNAQPDSHVACYPYATLGQPGAAIHVAYQSAGAYADIALIFNNDRTLAFSASNGVNPPSNFCTGVGAVSVAGGPADANLNAYGPTWVQKFDSTTGKVQFAAGNCGTGSTCTSAGMVTLDNVLKAVSQTVNVSCPADSAASPAYLGYVYTSGSGNGGGATTPFKITRIVDPYGIFGTCNSSATGYIVGSTPTGASGGTCAYCASGSCSQGYP